MAIGGVVINFVAKTTDAVRDIGRLDRSLDDVSKSGKNAGGKQGIGGFVSSMGAAIPIVGAVIVGVAGAATALWDAAKAAAEDKKQADNLARTLGTIPGITDAMVTSNAEWIDGMQLATQVADTDLRKAMGKLALATGDVDEAQKLVKLSADAAAGSGKSFSSVADAMAKAADGNSGSLKRMYPWLDKNKDGTVSLTEAQDGLKGAYEGAAEAAAKNDVWGTLKVIFDELKEAVGTALLPVLGDLADWFAKKSNQQKVQDFLDKVSDLATQVGEDLVTALKDLVKWLGKPENQAKLKSWATAMGDFAGDVSTVVGAIKQLVEWLGKIPAIGGAGPGNGRVNWNNLPWSKSAPAPSASARGVATTTATTTPAPAPPTVIVTEEQVYRAVQRLLLRGQARNGRLVVVG